MGDNTTNTNDLNQPEVALGTSVTASGARLFAAAEPLPRKVLSFGIPCYNSAEYMDHCISSILEGSGFADDVEVVIVDDGSTKDDTAEKADEWVRRYPRHVKAVHQENGGHGIAVLTGLANSTGTYYKVVDSDDWLDGDSLLALLEQVRAFEASGTRVDLVITNYVYEHVADGKSNVIDYRFALKRGEVLTWGEIGHFSMDQNLLMHSLCYRRDVLNAGGVPMPAHTFYVDNIYAYVPLPRCKTLYYLDVDLYRYFIGRDDQSVNESVMTSRVDQQLRVTRVMMEAYRLSTDVSEPKLRDYMQDYFSLMMSVSSIFTIKSERPEVEADMDQLWADLKLWDAKMYKKARHGILGVATNLPGNAGKKTTMGLYKIAQKIVKFN